MKQIKSLKQRIVQTWKSTVWDDIKTEDRPDARRYQWAVCRWCCYVTQVPFFVTIVLLMIIANTIVLATDSFPEPEHNLIGKTN